MDIGLTAQDRAFRDEVRTFLSEHVPPAMRRANDLTTGFIVEPDVSIHFHRALAPHPTTEPEPSSWALS